jgi:5-(carboxyamino)imidazole ribonucleotide synthase
MTSLPPGSTIGIVGGGQLGRMLALAAAQLGYRCHIYAPEPSGPAADVSAGWTQGAYDDAGALARFADAVDVVTYEFENIPVQALAALGGRVRLCPGVKALEIGQDRVREKDFVAGLGGRPATYRAVGSERELGEALAAMGAPAILKTRRLGYDGKGQARITAEEEAGSAWAALGGQPCVLEAMVSFDAEFSIIACRGDDGGFACWDAPENLHEEGILVRSTVPASPLVLGQVAEARELARRVADALDYVGVLTFEFFASPQGPVFNEMAPRVHNSGHWTIEGAFTSQFENHVRAICGLPLGSTALAARRVEMRNLIGAEAAEWPTILADPHSHLHLYGKHEARPGRKMGHVTRLTFDR